MIHLRHSAGNQIIHQRRQAAWQSAFWSLFLLLSAAFTALQTTLLSSVYEPGTTLDGIPFTIQPSEKPEPPLKHHKKPRLSPFTPSQNHLVTPLTTGQEWLLPPTELELQASPPEEESDFIETDATALLQAIQEPDSPAHRQNKEEGTEKYVPPAYGQCPSPPFPTTLRQRRQAKSVGVLIQVSAGGEPTEVSITQSSGISTLDQHTRSWIMKNWRFTPAQRNDTPVPARVSTEVHYTPR